MEKTDILSLYVHFDVASRSNFLITMWLVRCALKIGGLGDRVNWTSLLTIIFHEIASSRLVKSFQWHAGREPTMAITMYSKLHNSQID